MAKNDFKAFATDRNANVISQEEWEALPALLSGFTAGKASSAQVNKVIRQASFIAAALAQFVSDKTQRDVLDNGDLPGFVELLGSGFAVEYLSRKNPFGDIKSDGTVQTALENLDLGEAAKVSLGVDQNYVNVTSLRQSGVVYTNSTGKPILVSISILNERGKESSSLFIDDTEVASSAISPVSGAYSAVRSSVQAIVGNGKTYRLTGPGSVIGWSELR